METYMSYKEYESAFDMDSMLKTSLKYITKCCYGRKI
jgi:hypothetical protein